MTQSWAEEVHRELVSAGVTLVGFVPDGGHKRLIELCLADKSLRTVVMTTEEEGVGLAAGGWLGGAKSVLLMQSSGVGQRGERPRHPQDLRHSADHRGDHARRGRRVQRLAGADGRGDTQASFEIMGVEVTRASSARRRWRRWSAAALKSDHATAVLISQKVIGIKSFQEQANQ